MFCNSPFQGFGSHFVKIIGRGQSREDPRFCEACMKHGQEHPSGAYVDLAMLFADVRGSTPMAERIGDREFSRLIDRFFQVSARILIDSGAMLERLAGDEMIGFFVPGLAGSEFPQRTLECAKELLIATGHTDPEGSWIPLGVGVHFGNAFMGMVGSTEMVTNFTALGDDINVGARIASATGPGELLASLDLCQQAGIDEDGPEKRRINLKGKQEPMDVAVVPVN